MGYGTRISQVFFNTLAYILSDRPCFLLQTHVKDMESNLVREVVSVVVIVVLKQTELPITCRRSLYMKFIIFILHL
jgi:hypothetical protein